MPINSVIEDLRPNYQLEKITEVKHPLEVFTRLMIAFGAALNKKAVLVTTTHPNRHTVGMSDEFIDLMGGYSYEELMEMTGNDIFHPEDCAMAKTVGDNDLTSPYQIRIVRKHGGPRWCKVQGLSFQAGKISWRILIFEKIKE